MTWGNDEDMLEKERIELDQLKMRDIHSLGLHSSAVYMQVHRDSTKNEPGDFFHNSVISQSNSEQF